MEFNYIDEIAPFTEEQWNRIIAWHRKRSGRNIVQQIYTVQDLTAMREFQQSMERLHALAGNSQEELEKVSQAILNMAGEPPANVAEEY